MAAPQSIKHVAITKANTQMVAIVAVAAFISIFCLVAARSVWGQTRYQAKVIKEKETANKQLKDNITAFNSLVKAYNGFDNASINIIGGNSQGGGDNDGANSKIILDALPPTYNFPQLTSSVEKVLTGLGLHLTNISGTDDEINQQNNKASGTPQTVPMPFSFTISDANYAQVSAMIDALQKSIRPIQIDTMTLSGSQGDMTVTVNAHTYYQPVKSLGITKKVVSSKATKTPAASTTPTSTSTTTPDKAAGGTSATGGTTGGAQ